MKNRTMNVTGAEVASLGKNTWKGMHFNVRN